jgi:tRNA G18 (ribose-2'-O)-methylase SpoU
MRKLHNYELGRVSPDEYKQQPKRPIVLVLDNIRSAHNIGAALRTCDAFAVEQIMLCGICAVPPNAEIHKAALGAEFSVNWEYFSIAKDAVCLLKDAGYHIVGVEQTAEATPLHKINAVDLLPAALVFGNEINGVAQDVLDLCDECIEIPQAGTKHSLNVSVSIGVVLWELCRHLA